MDGADLFDRVLAGAALQGPEDLPRDGQGGVRGVCHLQRVYADAQLPRGRPGRQGHTEGTGAECHH
eukprot:6363-Eustigmatos_ZCMA.PRE.1